MIQEQVLEVAAKLREVDFKASTGWLQCFKNRYSVVRISVCDERIKVNTDDVDEWEKRHQCCCQVTALMMFSMETELGYFPESYRQKHWLKGRSVFWRKHVKAKTESFHLRNMKGNMEKMFVRHRNQGALGSSIVILHLESKQESPDDEVHQWKNSSSKNEGSRKKCPATFVQREASLTST